MLNIHWKFQIWNGKKHFVNVDVVVGILMVNADNKPLLKDSCFQKIVSKKLLMFIYEA